MTTLGYFSLGATFGFAAAVQPGPTQTFLASRAVANGWRRTLPAALAPLVSDVPIAFVALVVLSRMPPWLLRSLRAAGGVFLLYLAMLASLAAIVVLFAAARTLGARVNRALIGLAAVGLAGFGAWQLVLAAVEPLR